MKLSKTIPFFLTLFIVGALSTSQGQAPKAVTLDDEDYYLFPIKPYQTNTLAGTMGELRSSHFHAGLDIRTEGRTGLPVYAAADGYVSRAAVSTAGYGRALYITHTNGETTVYAHLERYNGPIALHVRNHQYVYKKFKVNLFLKKGQFQVRRGDIIGYSGNSGSSGGPHLHFEIRDKNQRVLNPLKYSFEEIKDKTPPLAKKLAIKTLSAQSRVQHQFGRLEFPVKAVGANYTVTDTIQVFGNIGFELYGYDWIDNSRFRCGISRITMKVDGKPVFEQKISSFNFAEQRNILAHMDYVSKKKTGEGFHKLYIDDGNFLNFYSTNQDKGRTSFNDFRKHKVEVDMFDPYNNKSTLTLFVQSAKPKTNAYAPSKAKTGVITHKLIDNTLVNYFDRGSEPSSNTEAYLYMHPKKITIKPSYTLNGNLEVYLWDMRKGTPDSITIGDKALNFDFKASIPPTIAYNFYHKDADITFPKHALFDTAYFKINKTIAKKAEGNENFIYEIGDPELPLRKNINVTLKPNRKVENQGKTRVYRVASSKYFAYQGGTWDNGKISFKTRTFGKYTLLTDSIPPRIKALKLNAHTLSFKISDNLSGIKDFNVTINGKWVLMNYDYKTNRIWSEKLDKSQLFQGDLELVVSDKSGNKKFYNTKIL